MPKPSYDPEAVIRDYFAKVPIKTIEKLHGITRKTVYDLLYRRKALPLTFPCEHCDRSFSSKRSLSGHVAKSHDGVMPSCARCRVLLTDENWYPAQKKRSDRVCKECVKKVYAVRAWRERRTVIEAYGGSCACCGETTLEFLTIDHINNDGAKHRRERGNGGSGVDFYRWLRQRGYPKEGFQLLCWNCNCAKGVFGSCPHIRSR